ncbi:MAG: deoxyribodipyrimidine photo-lyase [Methylococcaceae bacterium]|nr:deoxyribodipyrimidine photo-lyase [Methylococcaceae bacterium]
MSRYSLSLFIFRRDLRIDDNRALLEALSLSDSVLPCFIFDPRQINKHPYQSLPALQFMLDSINDLQSTFEAIDGKLALFQGLPSEIVKKVFKTQRIDAVFVGRDYTPFSRHRDKELADACQKLGIEFHSVPDTLLLEPEQALKADRSPYKVFTAFYNNARRFPVPLPVVLDKTKFVQGDSGLIEPQELFPQIESRLKCQSGGRTCGLTILAGLERQNRYQEERDSPGLDATSRLSAHLKFGTCSVREVYYAIVHRLGTEHPLLRQLYWRDFFTHIAFYFPYVFGKAFHSRYDNLVWENSLATFQRWSEGTTGFPIVDAGMRELNATGFMHNRVRMITASFLTKDLHISWRWGERYFAQHLVDYDPAVNNGNWQWAASTGCDAQPYFRIFNPWLQQRKFDPECRYIYRWIPELKAMPPQVIHKGDRHPIGSGYPMPMVDHAVESKRAIVFYKAVEKATQDD